MLVKMQLYELQTLVRTRRQQRNKFVNDRVIPLGRNRNGEIVTMPYKDFSGALGIIGTSGVGKSCMVKRIYSYMLYFYNKVLGRRRPGIIFDLQSEDHWRSKDENTDPYPLFYQQGEIPVALKNLVCYAPTFTYRECHSFDKLFGFDLSVIDRRDMRSMNLKPTSTRTLYRLFVENAELLKNPDVFFENFLRAPTSDREFEAIQSDPNFKLRMTSPLNFNVKAVLEGVLETMLTDKVFVGTNSEYYKKSFIEDLKQGKIVCINFHQMQEYMGLYIGVILKDLYLRRRLAYRKGDNSFPCPVIIIEEADLALSGKDTNLEEGATKWTLEILRRGRRYGFYTILCTQQASSLHPQVKEHTRQWIISSVPTADLKFFKDKFAPHVIETIKSLDLSRNEWGAVEWCYVYNHGRSCKTFYPYNSPVNIVRGGGTT